MKNFFWAFQKASPLERSSREGSLLSEGKKESSSPLKVPQHVAIIMDGNGRWARERGHPKGTGHQKGAEVAQAVVEAAAEFGVSYITLYAFSSENWQRPPEEVNLLMDLLRHYLKSEISHLHKNKVRLQVIGSRDRLPADIQKLIHKTEESTKDYSHLTLLMAISYGGREDILNACRKIAVKVKEGVLRIEDIEESTIQNHLSTAHIPDPDLFIRTSGELRMSNFLNWQLSYAEFFFSQKYWPDFTKEDFRMALVEYSKRERRFGHASS